MKILFKALVDPHPCEGGDICILEPPEHSLKKLREWHKKMNEGEYLVKMIVTLESIEKRG